MEDQTQPQMATTIDHAEECSPMLADTECSARDDADSKHTSEDHDQALPDAARPTKRVRFSSILSSNDVTQLAISACCCFDSRTHAQVIVLCIRVCCLALT